MNQLEIKSQIIKETYEDIKIIHKQIKETQEIIKMIRDLAELQTDGINQIDDNVTKTNTSVEKGTEDLNKAKKYFDSKRLFWTGVIIGGIISGIATSGLGIPIWSVCTVSGGIAGGIISKKL